MSTWIFLRGLMRECRHWGDFPPLFSEQLKTRNIVLADLPGNGSLHRMASPARVDDMADYYRSVAAGIGFAPPYRLLGLSMGAMIAVSWAHRFPAELDACVLLNTSLRPFSPFYHRLNWRNYPELFRLIWNPDPAERERRILRLTSARPDLREKIAGSWIAYQRQYPVSRSNGLLQLAAAARFHAPVTRPDVPILVLASAKDHLVDPLCSMRLANAWQTEIAIHPDAGHDLPLDDGLWVAQQVNAWLNARGLDSPPGSYHDSTPGSLSPPRSITPA